MKNLCEALMDFLISPRWQEKRETKEKKYSSKVLEKYSVRRREKKKKSSMEFEMGLDKNRRNELEN